MNMSVYIIKYYKLFKLFQHLPCNNYRTIIRFGMYISFQDVSIKIQITSSLEAWSTQQFPQNMSHKNARNNQHWINLLSNRKHRFTTRKRHARRRKRLRFYRCQHSPLTGDSLRLAVVGSILRTRFGHASDIVRLRCDEFRKI